MPFFIICHHVGDFMKQKQQEVFWKIFIENIGSTKNAQFQIYNR